MKDVTGERFGCWVVNSTFPKINANGGKEAYCDVTCDCGTSRIVRAANLRCGKSKSCGCQPNKTSYFHALSSGPVPKDPQVCALPECENIFPSRNSASGCHTIFCSVECFNKAASSKVEKECLTCSTIFLGNYDSKYCSIECRDKRPGTQRVQRICAYPECAKSFLEFVSVISFGGGVYCSRQCSYDHRSVRFIGDKSPRWLGGTCLSNGTQRGPGWKKTTKKVRKRDKYTCQDCGKTEEELGHTFHAHHIVPFWNSPNWRKANVLSNLRCLCNRCHGIAEGKVPAKQMVFISQLVA